MPRIHYSFTLSYDPAVLPCCQKHDLVVWLANKFVLMAVDKGLDMEFNLTAPKNQSQMRPIVILYNQKIPQYIIRTAMFPHGK